MPGTTKTIFALSSGSLPSGVAVIRVSGPMAGDAGKALCGDLPPPRHAGLRTIRQPENGETLDRGLVLWMPGPSSFTGEDSLELHVHGGRAVVDSILHALGRLKNCRLAEAGEFSLRAFENGRMDLTEAEGLADLITAQTELQRRQAILQSGGALRRKLEAWRQELIRIRAMIEAGLDFSDEDDLSKLTGLVDAPAIAGLEMEIASFLSEGEGGEIVREGFRVALTGKPNAGKSSLLNALARRDVAIVDEDAGTTRDVLEVHLNLDGLEIIVSDTAGIRETTDRVEAEGIRRAVQEAIQADLVLWLDAGESGELPAEFSGLENRCVIIPSKVDISNGGKGTGTIDSDHTRRAGPGISVVVENGLDEFISWLSSQAISKAGNPEIPRVTRLRHRMGLEECKSELALAHLKRDDPELCAEHLRIGSDSLGRLTGKIDVEDLLDVIFSEFCIGK